LVSLYNYSSSGADEILKDSNTLFHEQKTPAVFFREVNSIRTGRAGFTFRRPSGAPVDIFITAVYARVYSVGSQSNERRDLDFSLFQDFYRYWPAV
jgi:hypothetical protein